MAYGTKYRGGWHGAKSGINGYLYIDELDYTGAINDILLDDNSIIVSYTFEDWNNPIIGLTLEFSVRNDRTNFFELLPLMTIQERQFKVRVVTLNPTASTVFEGFLNSENNSQTVLHKQPIRLVASSYLSKLEHGTLPSIETLQYVTFIDVIDEALRLTGSTFNIRVNSTLFSNGDLREPATTLFHKNGFYTELFWEDNVKRLNPLQIVTSILKTFDCYLYWWDGYWYIERYEDIWGMNCYGLQSHSGSNILTAAGKYLYITKKVGNIAPVLITYVEYTSGESYLPSEHATALANIRECTDLHSLTFMEQSQTLYTEPGLKKITVNLKDKRLLNLLPDMTGITSVPNWETNLNPYPAYRTWQKWDTTTPCFIYTGTSFGAIADSIKREVLIDGSYPLDRGLYATTKVTVERETVMNIKYKYNANGLRLGEGESYNFYLTIQYVSPYPTPGYSWYVVQDENTSVWKIRYTTILVTSPPTLSTAYIKVNTSDFDPLTNITNVETSVPIGTINSLIGDKILVIGFCGVELVKADGTTIINSGYDYWGDFNVTTTGGVQENVIEGTISTNFINTKEIELDLYDILDYNYRNGIYRGDALDTRTTGWTTNGDYYFPITDRLLKNKFQLYNVTRQRYTADVEQLTALRPLQKFYDSKQSNKTFILTQYDYNLTRDYYRVELREYNNMTDISIKL